MMNIKNLWRVSLHKGLETCKSMEIDDFLHNQCNGEKNSKHRDARA